MNKVSSFRTALWRLTELTKIHAPIKPDMNSRSHHRYYNSRHGADGYGGRGGHRGRGGYGGQRDHRYSQEGEEAQSAHADMYSSSDHRDPRQGAAGYGGRGGQGHRGGHRGRDRHEVQYGQPKYNDDTEHGLDNRRGRGRRLAPSHLRGRELGMWFARRSKARTKQKDLKEMPVISLDGLEGSHIEEMLHDMNSEGRNKSDANVSTVSPTDSNRRQAAFHQSLPVGNYDDFAEPGPSNLHAPVDQSDALESNDDKMYPAVVELFPSDLHIGDGVFMEPLEDTVRGPAPSRKDSMRLKERFLAQQTTAEYKSMQPFRRKLPSYDRRHEIVKTIADNQVVVISGETGCGKTTQIPQFILDDFLLSGAGSQCKIVCTQPRRISTITVAERVAAERGEQLQDSVGYCIRLDDKRPRRSGSITFFTTGILMKILEGDPYLRCVSHVVLDEIHERDILSDFALIILKDILRVRPELKVILMSATLNAEAFSQYFDNCPMLNIPGLTYPVQTYLLEDIVEMLNYQFPKEVRLGTSRTTTGKFGRDRPWEEEQVEYSEKVYEQLQGRYSGSTLNELANVDAEVIDIDLIVELIRHISTTKGDGAILVFVPGWAEISNIYKRLTNDRMFSPRFYKIFPLHSMMPTVNQREIFQRPPNGVRKIIIATNIAETSITIDDVVFVIDSGMIKMKDYVAESKFSTLTSKLVAKANAKQRRGRAGRVQPGECYHMFSSVQYEDMNDFTKPEILRTRLEELCLNIKLLKKGKIEPFLSKAMAAPPMPVVHSAIEFLQALNALDQDENLLPLGKHLARMPVDPQLGKMILFGAMFSCLDPILIIAASHSFMDPFVVPLEKTSEADKARKRLSEGSNSDQIMLVNAYHGWETSRSPGQYCHENFLSSNTLTMLSRIKQQFKELLRELRFITHDDHQCNVNSDNEGLVKAVICAGLYPNVAKIYSQKRDIKVNTKYGLRATLHPKCVITDLKSDDTKWLVYHLQLKTSLMYLHDATLVSPYPLLFFGGNIGMETNEDHQFVTVDDWIKFKASPDTVDRVKNLRRELDSLLEEKIQQPGPTNWDSRHREGALLNAIITLVTMEKEQARYRPSAMHIEQGDEQGSDRSNSWQW